jgi:hypothetical protein
MISFILLELKQRDNEIDVPILTTQSRDPEQGTFCGAESTALGKIYYEFFTYDTIYLYLSRMGGARR